MSSRYSFQSTNAKRAKRKSKFCPKEDQELRDLVAKHGEDWELISSMMPGRNFRQVRDRYCNYLSPNVNIEPFTPEEDILILQKVEEFGPRWVFMRQFFNKRSDSALKNRWLVIERRLSRGLPVVDGYTTDSEDQVAELEDQKPGEPEIFDFLELKPEDMLHFWSDVYGGFDMGRLDSLSYVEYSCLY